MLLLSLLLGATAWSADPDTTIYIGTYADSLGLTDASSAVNPDAPETWSDGVDQDCDGASDYDADSDGHDAILYGGDDCDDTDAAINPDAAETWYDGVDQDCDGANDYDQDGDGFVAEGYELEVDDTASNTGDCDDTDPAITAGCLDGDTGGLYYQGGKGAECSCAAGMSRPSSLWAAGLLGLLGLRRRRRA